MYVVLTFLNFLSDRENFLSFSEEDFLSILREQVLSEDEFCSLKEKLISELAL